MLIALFIQAAGKAISLIMCLGFRGRQAVHGETTLFLI
jgi:type VI protein secretion system component VasF